MRWILLVAWCAFCVLLSVVGGVLLFNWFVNLPGEMPFFLDRAIRFGFRVFLHDDMPDPDADMAPVAGLVYLLCAVMLVGIIVAIVGTILWRRFATRRKSSA